MNPEIISSEDHSAETSGLFDELVGHYASVPASLGQRFLNFLIDNLLMRFGLSYVSGTVVGYMIGMMAPDFALSLGTDQFNLYLISYAIAMLNYLIYYTFCEAVFKGYTLGKLITGTRAVAADGSALTLKQAFLRTLSRLVPFEAFSAFGQQPWHDSWTKTTVIKSR